MIIYNVTIKVEEQVAKAWLHWLLYEHIPEIMATACFSKYQVVRLLETDDSEGPTYATQYFAESMADYNRYLEIHATGLRKRSADKWGQQVYAFRSVMQVVQ